MRMSLLAIALLAALAVTACARSSTSSAVSTILGADAAGASSDTAALRNMAYPGATGGTVSQADVGFGGPNGGAVGPFAGVHGGPNGPVVVQQHTPDSFNQVYNYYAGKVPGPPPPILTRGNQTTATFRSSGGIDQTLAITLNTKIGKPQTGMNVTVTLTLAKKGQ